MAHPWGVLLRVAAMGVLGAILAACALNAGSFAVSNLQVDRGATGILTGDEVTISAQVHNTSEREATYHAELTINGSIHSSQDVELGGAEARAIQFVVEAGPPGEYQVGLGEERTTFQVAGAPSFTVSDLQVVAGLSDFQAGDLVQLTALVHNTGAAGTYDAVLLVNDSVYSESAVDLAQGEDRTIDFAVEAGPPGDYEVRLGEERLTFHVTDIAAFTVSDLQVLPGETEILAGDQVTVTAEVRNTGGVDGTYRAELTIDGSVHSSRDVELAAGEATIVEFVVEAGPMGTYELRLGEASTSLTVPAPAAFMVRDLTVTPSEVDRGAQVTVSVTITNIGGLSGTYAVELMIDGALDQAREVNLAGGEWTTVDFTIDAGSTGRHVIAVGDLETELAVFTVERPANGAILVNKVRGGMGRLTIENGNDRDAVVVLAKTSDLSKPLLAVYIREGKSRTIRRIRDGNYTLLYSLGERWDSGARAFTSDVIYRQSSGSLEFRTTRVSGGYRYTIWTVTLHTVPGGDTPVINIDEDDFPLVP
jgi:hypothetical protein